jgi:hypothetical protein
MLPCIGDGDSVAALIRFDLVALRRPGDRR